MLNNIKKNKRITIPFKNVEFIIESMFFNKGDNPNVRL